MQGQVWYLGRDCFRKVRGVHWPEGQEHLCGYPMCGWLKPYTVALKTAVRQEGHHGGVEMARSKV
jgi:hypothetical protein